MSFVRKILLAFILLVAPVVANAQQSQFYIIDDFSKMLTSHVSPYKTKDAIDVLNVRADDQFGALAKRPVLNLVGSCHSSAVTSLHRYYKSDATKYTIDTSDTYIDYISDTGICTTLKSTETSGKRWSWLTYKDLAIGMNGYDMPVKWDGKTLVTDNTDSARTTGEVATELGAPFAELNTTSDSVNVLAANRWYQYHVAFFDGTNFSYTTSRSNPIYTGSTVRNVTLTDIPLGPAGTTYRYLYRTASNDTKSAALANTTYYHIASLNDNYTRTYNDVSSDTVMVASDSSPKWSTASGGINMTPPKSRHMFLNKERIFAGNDPSGTTYGKSTLYFSDILNPDYWNTGSNYFLIRPDDGDEITFINSFLGNLFIGKTNTISQLFTNYDPKADSPTSNWSLSQPISYVGCVSPYSAVSSPIGILYLGKQGLFQFDGNFSKIISDAVTKEIRDINPINYSIYPGIFYNNEYRLGYTSLSSGSSVNDHVLIFDTIRDSYTKDSEGVGAWSIFNSADDYGALYSGSSTSDGKIFAHSTVPNNLIYRYESELNSGTLDSVTVSNSETNPVIQLGWNISIDSTSVAGVTIDAASYDTATVNRKTTTGYWYSPASQINAASLQKLYWNASLGVNGSISFAIKTASTQAGLTSAAWSSEYSAPSGSDISGVSANTWIQLRATLSTTDITETPLMIIQDNFMIKLSYSKAGTVGETSVLSFWKTGWLDLDSSVSQLPKLLQEVDVYYEGTAGTVTITIQNLKGDVVGSFDIDLSKNRKDTQQYFGRDSSKVFRYNTPSVPMAANYLFGDKFQIIISENGVTNWKIQRLVLRYLPQEYTPYR